MVRLRETRKDARRRSVDAFTLMELLVSVVILSTGIVLVLRAFASSVNALDASQDVLRARELIQAEMARVEQELLGGDPDLIGRSSRFDGYRIDTTALARELPVGANRSAARCCDVEVTVRSERTGQSHVSRTRFAWPLPPAS